MSFDLLIEIGTEELPISEVSDIIEYTNNEFENFFEDNRINYNKLYTTGTPRRIVIIADGVEEKQIDKTIVNFGPPENIAKDKDGNWTKAATGFCKRFNIDVKDIEIKEKGNGKYLAVQELIKGEKTKKLLKDNFEKLMNNVHCRKKMRWNNSGFKFSRPIRWLTALTDSEQLDLTLANINSSKISYGHRFLANKQIEISSIKNYFNILQDNFVLADMYFRKQTILKQIKDIIDDKTEYVEIDEDLLNTVTFLVEYPIVFKGKFDDKFLILPEKVLVSTMRTHQKYFPVYSKDKKIKPYFIGVSNMSEKHIDNIITGNERVLQARFEDAAFYFEVDKKVGVEEFLEKQKGKVYIEGIGNLFDKTQRLKLLTRYIGEKLDLSEKELSLAEKGAKLLKIDLMSGMVGEFPHLQGYIGKIYAQQKNIESEIAAGIYEHYLPEGKDDSLPSKGLSSIFSIADKIDSVVSCYLLELIPTGSKDPYALRRAIRGILKILLNYKYELNISNLLDFNITICQKYLSKQIDDISEVKNKILDFIEDRIKNLFLEFDFTIDKINSVINVENKNWNIIEYQQKLDSLNKMSKDANLLKCSKGFKRINNIIKKIDKTVDLKKELLNEEPEKKLYREFCVIKENAKEYIKNKDYLGLISKLASLGEWIDGFFDKVLVMDKDINIKNNRLAMLKEISLFYKKLFDFSELTDVVEEE